MCLLSQEPTYVDFSLAAVFGLLLMPSREEGATDAVDEGTRPAIQDGSKEFQAFGLLVLVY